MSTTDTDLKRQLDEESRRYADSRDRFPREPESLERDIDATRADLRATIEALERRLSFDRLVELTVGRVRERGGEFAGNLTDAATQNPVPMLLTSIGLGWMMLTSRRGGGRAAYRDSSGMSAGESLGEAADSARAKFGDAAASARESFGSAAESARETLGGAAASARETFDSWRAGSRDAASTARRQAEYARDRMERLLEEQPLMLGALGLAAGAIIGALLPTTEAEDRWIGDARDKAVGNLARTSRARYDAAREHAATYSAPGNSGADDAERASTSRPH